jgi:hypothetical protein
MRILAFIPGLTCMAFGGYLAVQESNVFGWFLGVGFILTLCALGILDDTVVKQPKQPNEEGQDEEEQ